MYIPFLAVSNVFALSLLIIATSIFLISQFKSDNSLMDIAYGPTFFIAGLATALLLKSYSPLTIVILIAIALWSLRLGVRIYRKNHGQAEDIRYASWRQEWLKKGRLYFLFRSLIQINMLQGLIILFVSLPIIISLTDWSTKATDSLFATNVIIGLLVFVIGLTLETVADAQIDDFVKRKKRGLEKSMFLQTGLFRYSRRPNYFGETLVWWGLAIIVLPLPYGYLALLSPILITFIVVKVTGPMLEKIFLAKYGPSYEKYMETTSYMIPLPPKSR